MEIYYLKKFIELNIELCNNFKTLLRNNNNKNKYSVKLEDINKCI